MGYSKAGGKTVYYIRRMSLTTSRPRDFVRIGDQLKSADRTADSIVTVKSGRYRDPCGISRTVDAVTYRISGVSIGVRTHARRAEQRLSHHVVHIDFCRTTTAEYRRIASDPFAPACSPGWRRMI